MTRNARLEAFLRARYELDTCEPEARVRCEANLTAIANALIELYGRERGRGLSLHELFQATSDANHEYRRAQVRLQQSRINRPR